MQGLLDYKNNNFCNLPDFLPKAGSRQYKCTTVQSAKRLYPSCSRSNKKRIKFLAKPTQNPRKFLAKSTLLPRLFHARQRELREISRLFHVQQKKSRSRKKTHVHEKKNLEVHVHVKYYILPLFNLHFIYILFV